MSQQIRHSIHSNRTELFVVARVEKRYLYYSIIFAGDHILYQPSVMSSDIETKHLNIVASSNHQFMVNLYRVLATEDENIFFSPISIYIALVLVYLGSNGETAEELQKTLFPGQNKEDLLEGVRKLLLELKHPELNTATEMFVEQSYKLQTKYKNDAKKFVNSESQLVDFITAADAATELINSWVSSQTKNKINNLIPAGTLDETTRLVLVNAIHFKDDWLKQFEKEATFKEKFFKTKDNFDEVDMMHLTSHFRFTREESFQALELPYKNQNFKMLIFLPNEIDGLPALEQSLPSLNIGAILNKMTREKVEVTLPKFKLEKFVELNEALKKLGIKAMFDSFKADLTGIHEPTESRLVVSKALHKAFVEVNEEGTEAAAATGMIMMMACSARIERVHRFRCDHPFIFNILHNQTTLFTGTIKTKP